MNTTINSGDPNDQPIADPELITNAALEDLYHQVCEFTRNMLIRKIQIETAVRAQRNLERFASVDTIVHKAEKQLEGLCKELRRLKELMDQNIVALQIGIQNSAAIKTEWGAVSTKVSMIAKVPKPDREDERDDWRLLVEHLVSLGADRLVEKDLIRIHWPGMVEYCTDLAAAAKPYPPGVDPSETTPRFSTRVTCPRLTEVPEDV